MRVRVSVQVHAWVCYTKIRNWRAFLVQLGHVWATTNLDLREFVCFVKCITVLGCVDVFLHFEIPYYCKQVEIKCTIQVYQPACWICTAKNEPELPGAGRVSWRLWAYQKSIKTKPKIVVLIAIRLFESLASGVCWITLSKMLPSSGLLIIELATLSPKHRGWNVLVKDQAGEFVPTSFEGRGNNSPCSTDLQPAQSLSSLRCLVWDLLLMRKKQIL